MTRISPPRGATDEQLVFGTICQSRSPLTPRALEKSLCSARGLDHRRFQKALKSLIRAGDIAYTYRFGCSFVERSFNRAVRVSDKVVLQPPGLRFKGNPDDVVVQIQAGASFGSGAHPTTRLALRALEKALGGIHHPLKNCSALDIGTGSGVLAITAARFGFGSVLGLDIDPCALSEAKKNVGYNGLGGQIEICDTAPDRLDRRFDLIMANLRYPTLKQLCGLLAGLFRRRGILVLSGVKGDEADALVSRYVAAPFELIHRCDEKNWTGLTFRATLPDIET